MWGDWRIGQCPLSQAKIKRQRSEERSSFKKRVFFFSLWRVILWKISAETTTIHHHQTVCSDCDNTPSSQSFKVEETRNTNAEYRQTQHYCHTTAHCTFRFIRTNIRQLYYKSLEHVSPYETRNLFFSATSLIYNIFIKIICHVYRLRKFQILQLCVKSLTLLVVG